MATRRRWIVIAAMAVGLAFPAVVFADAPTADDKPSVTTAEDTLVTIQLSGGDTEGDPLTFAPLQPGHGTVDNPRNLSCAGVPSICTEDVDYTPASNYNGSDSFTYTTNDGVLDSNTATVTISISPVNDPPSFTKGADQTVLTDAGAQSITGWATAINPGAPDETSDVLTFNWISDDNSALFSVEPAIDAITGDLTFTIAGTTGTAHIAFTLSDNGGGTNTSAQQTVTITVDNLVAHNDGATIPEGAAATAINVLANDNPLPNQQVPLTITGFPLLPAHGTVAITGGGTGLTYKPTTHFFGSDSFSYTITHGALTAQATVVVTVSKDVTGPVETAPVEQMYVGTSIGTSTVLTRISWSATDPGTGVVKYELWRQIDGGAWVLVSLPTPTTTALPQTLSFGHTYRYRARATDFNGNVGTIVYGPAFHTYLYQDNNTTVHYGGTWASFSNTNNSGGTTHYTSTAGRSATWSFFGRDFAFVAPTSSIRGSVRIYFDGVLVATVSEHTSTSVYRRVLWQRRYASLATHTIKIVAVGGARIDLDCFVAFR